MTNSSCCLRLIRTYSGLDRMQLSFRLNLPLMTIINLELGREFPDESILKKYSIYSGMPMDALDFLCREESDEDPLKNFILGGLYSAVELITWIV